MTRYWKYKSHWCLTRLRLVWELRVTPWVIFSLDPRVSKLLYICPIFSWSSDCTSELSLITRSYLEHVADLLQFEPTIASWVLCDGGFYNSRALPRYCINDWPSNAPYSWTNFRLLMDSQFWSLVVTIINLAYPPLLIHRVYFLMERGWRGSTGELANCSGESVSNPETFGCQEADLRQEWPGSQGS